MIIGETKIQALKYIFHIENIDEKLSSSKKITGEVLLHAISKHDYNLKEELSMSAAGVYKLLKRVFPDRVTSHKICTYLLNKYNKKYCPSCNLVYTKELFFSDTRTITGTSSWCKECYYKNTNVYKKEYQAKRKSENLNRLPNWANIEKIKEIYDNCPEGNHVDHIIPLKGKLVSGLHVENNLQYLPAKENILKNNRFIVN